MKFVAESDIKRKMKYYYWRVDSYEIMDSYALCLCVAVMIAPVLLFLWLR